MHIYFESLIIYFKWEQQYSAAEARRRLVQWIVCDDQSFSVVENIHFQRLIQLLRPEEHLVSKSTIHNDIVSMFRDERDQIKIILQVIKLFSIIIVISIDNVYQ